jgi:8-oxo-dGTP pyrophosphatase MutT (NUDIX family)
VVSDAIDDPLLSCVRRFTPRSDDEARDVERVISLIADGRPWDRSQLLHVTASALIVHPPTRRVLLRWHERQQAWLQVGGHADAGERDPLAVALREGAEETGLGDLRPWRNGDLQHVVVVPVPANDREPAHEHADLRFVLVTDEPDVARPEHQTAKLEWLSRDDAVARTTEANVKETISRAANLLK